MAKKSTDELAERYALMKEERDAFEAQQIRSETGLGADGPSGH